MNKQQSGFTLIELIIVIVILGILAVTAAPKFIDIQSDAQTSTLQGVKAALQSGSQLIYAKSAIANIQKDAYSSGNTQVSVGGNTVETDYGYPNAETTTTIDILNNWVDISSDDFTLTVGSGGPSTSSPANGTFALAPIGKSVDFRDTGVDGDSCHVLYTEATNANTPSVVTVVAGGC